MGYEFEELGDERFQQFCQALLLREFPDVQCLPVGQPDGGRDALRMLGPQRSGLSVYQVKYVREPLKRGIDPVEWLEAAIDGELPKIEELIERGARHYTLMTNVPGTAHADSGRIDRLTKVLKAKIRIDADCWWRDDLERRLDGQQSLRWAYPELLRPGDLLRQLLEGGITERTADRLAAISAFLAQAYEDDKEVRFKQVDLQNLLLDLFVDVPASIRAEPDKRRQWYVERWLVASLSGPSPYFGFWEESISDDNWVNRQLDVEITRGAASLLLLDAIQVAMPRIVIEAGPGQGKSTLAQYLCQVHRMRLRGDASALAQLPDEHRVGPVRVPFRVDLRDLATWLTGGVPSRVTNTIDETTPGPRTLEGWLAALVHTGSGGIAFSVGDLHAVAKASAVLLVLDGLDEVADVTTRASVVREIQAAVTRLESNALSVQVVVTSRPAAFVNTPSFSSTRFHKWELLPLTKRQIADYRDRWMKARNLRPREGHELTSVLASRLAQPHMRDLARNPMQLAILLHLIHQRGSSLPDKRSELYGLYIDSYVARETEKNSFVLAHRELLISIHEYLGWLLHGEAERPGGDGRITDDRLKVVLRDYLQAEGHPTDIVSELFGGVVQRVAALVSSKEGAWEFEVQPLREYFAACYLYKTAPWSPAGQPRPGSRADRFDAIARNFYWLNVSRFFGGLADKGELAMLSDRVRSLAEDEQFRPIAHPRLLASMLMADYVFTQQPRTAAGVVDFLLEHDTIRLLSTPTSSGVAVPDGPTRSHLVRRVIDRLGRGVSREFGDELAQVLADNASPAEIAPAWVDVLESIPQEARDAWFWVGVRSGAIAGMSAEDADGLASKGCSGSELLTLVRGGHEAIVLAREPLFAAATAQLTSVPVLLGSASHSPLSAFAALVVASSYPFGVRGHRGRARNSVIGIHAQSDAPPLPTVSSSGSTSGRVSRVIDAFNANSLVDVHEWKSSLVGVNAVVEALRDGWGDCVAAQEIAISAASLRVDPSPAALGADLFDGSVPLADRCRAARYRSGQIAWWQKAFRQCSPDQLPFLIRLAVAWVSPKVLRSLAPALEDSIRSMSTSDFSSIEGSMRRISSAAGRNRELGPETLEVITSVRLAVLLIPRAPDRTRLSIYNHFLASYEGDEPVILVAAGKVALQQLTSPGDWPRLLDWVHRADAAGAAYPAGLRASHPAGAVAMTRSDATRVLDNLASYPSWVIGVAEKAIKDELAARATPVLDEAEADKWFAAPL